MLSVLNGMTAPGTWTSSDTFGNPDTFRQNIAVSGYYIYSLPVAQQLAADRAARKAPTVQIAVKLAGGINTPELVATLEKLGLTVYYLPNPATLDEMYTNLETVATLTGHAVETATLVDSLKKRVAAVDARILPLDSRPTVYYEIDATDPTAGSRPSARCGRSRCSPPRTSSARPSK